MTTDALTPPFERDELLDAESIVGARWWNRELKDEERKQSRRAALTMLGVGLVGVGSVGAIAAAASAMDYQFQRQPSLGLQRRFGWSFGAFGESITFDGRMLTKEGARTSPSGRPEGDPFRGATQARFMTVTLSWLMIQGMPSTQSLAATCEIPENALWQRNSFRRILERLGRVQFSAIKSDVFYVIPGDDAWGLTEQDLRGSKFEYLRQIQG